MTQKKSGFKCQFTSLFILSVQVLQKIDGEKEREGEREREREMDIERERVSA